MVSSPRIRAATKGDFWGFSNRCYARPGVAAVCLDLQDRSGRDVNLLLYAAWVGASGRGRLAPADLARAEAAVAPWRREVVEPLRQIRRRVKATPDSAALHATLKAGELQAEAHAQALLEAVAPAPDARPAAARRADALANLRLYLGHAAPAPLRRALAAEIAA
jgi:uncharacterized protein (TIGR02444 family)